MARRSRTAIKFGEPPSPIHKVGEYSLKRLGGGYAPPTICVKTYVPAVLRWPTMSKGRLSIRNCSSDSRGPHSPAPINLMRQMKSASASSSRFKTNQPRCRAPWLTRRAASSRPCGRDLDALPRRRAGGQRKGHGFQDVREWLLKDAEMQRDRARLMMSVLAPRSLPAAWLAPPPGGRVSLEDRTDNCRMSVRRRR